MGYSDKYPDMFAMYAFQFEYENKLKDKIKELETELERTRKALDKAKWWLKEIVENHRFTPISTAEMALKEITALEQKKTAFVNNKIKFPEYNDNLLEEFDKQFFENGQDDI